ncbi:hypothetical protein R1sor_025517 [Riccia sorocarpa]|uniref:Uncharacterized protein n=1 Tax=Riccia sorocarpa TaxID=122646 RepID=A0ABD3GAW0_9MARC
MAEGWPLAQLPCNARQLNIGDEEQRTRKLEGFKGVDSALERQWQLSGERLKPQAAMEALSHLQSIQATLQLMQEHSLCSNDESSDRFAAEFFLFLAQKSSDLEALSNRCATLIHLLPKVSTTFLGTLCSGQGKEGASLPLEGNYRVESPIFQEIPSTQENANHLSPTQGETPKGVKKGFNPPMTSYESFRSSSVPYVGLRAMEKARSTLEDFCRSYFMFHDMDVTNPQHTFRCLPILYFTEAFIYQLDEENEEKLQPPQIRAVEACSSAPAPERLFPRQAPQEMPSVVFSDDYMQTCSDEEKETEGEDSDSGSNLEADPFKGLKQVLISKGLMTERIESEFKDGAEYWRLERKLSESAKLGAPVSKEEVFRAITLKSFDYRILNHLLYSLTHRMVDEDHLEFLAVAELLVEVADDLFDYEEDVLKNSFNVLRMLIYACGPTEAPAVLAGFISAQERRYQELLGNLDPGLGKRFQERCKEAVKEGGGVSKSGTLGSWTIPPLIVDEAAFRNQVSCDYAPVIREI